MGIESPSPLSIASITKGACAHRTVTNKKKHWIITLTTAAGDGTCLVSDVDGIRSEVAHSIDVNPYVTLGIRSEKGKTKKQK
jgi:hypothetical protein